MRGPASEVTRLDRSSRVLCREIRAEDENGSIAATARGVEQGDRRLHAVQRVQRGAGVLQEGDGHAGGDRQEVLGAPGEEVDFRDQASEEGE